MWEKLFLFIFIMVMISPTQSAVLECYWDQQMTTCSPYNITLLSQPNEVITVSGKPSDYVDPSTTSALFYDQVFNYLPTGLFTIFPNLNTLGIDGCKIAPLTTDSIPNCRMLTSLYLRSENFLHIPAGFLQSCKSLNFIDMRIDNITTIDVDAFKGLTNLTMLDLTYNKISCLPPGLFQHMPLISYVNLRLNLITSIDSNLFANLFKLNGFDLSNNLLSFIPKLNLTLDPVNEWFNFGFAVNPIYAITPDFCSIFEAGPKDSTNIFIFEISCIQSDSNNMYLTITPSTCQNYSTQLQNCYANWTSSMVNAPVPCAVQPPTTLPPTTISPTTVPITTEPPTTQPPTTAVITTPSPTPGPCPSDKICRYFLDQYNRYTCILDGVDSVLTSISGNHLITFSDPNVRRVIFTNSFLSRIPPILFQKFPSLEYLTVSNCSMSAINTNTFSACGTLKYFDASSNFITTVDGASFKSCAALEVIDLTGNNFDMISGQLFVNNPMLKAVYINRPPAMVLV